MDDFLKKGPTEEGHPRNSTLAFYMLLPLHDEVKELSSVVMKVLLGSETLQLRSENDAYYLLCAWLSQAQCIPDEPERQTLFKKLVPQLRFHHMSPDFLCAVISVCPYANASGLIPYIRRCSQALRVPPPARTKAKGLKWCFNDRSKGHPEYTFRGNYKLAELSLLGKLPTNATGLHLYLGLAAGFPVAVYVKHKAEGTMGVYVHVEMPPWQGFDTENSVGWCVGFVYSIKVGELGFTSTYFFERTYSWGYPNFFKKKWEEVVYPSSPYFPDGELTLDVTMKPVMGVKA